MTKEENIKGLEAVKKECGRYLDESFAWICEPIDEAIKALEQQSSDSEIPNNSTADDCVSRKAVIKALDCEIGGCIESDIDLSKYKREFQEFANMILDAQTKSIQALPPVTPIHGTCKDCKNWKDSDGAYRRGIWAESKCPVNNASVFEGTFYCADFKKRGVEDGI